MPPRKSKAIKETPSIISDTPVVFFLKIGEEDEQHDITPAGNSISYSDILNAVENSEQSQPFNTELLRTVLDKVSNDRRYTAQTSCFWCCHGFSWVSSVLPRSYDAYKNMYSVEGHFCSPECALAYNYADNKISDSQKWTQHAMLRSLYFDAYKDKLLSPAPPRTLLRMFGGPLDIAQFREYCTHDNHIIQSELPPIRVVFPSMNVQGPLRDIKKFVSLNADVVEKASEQLRLKRSKPLNANVPTLDMVLRRSD